MKQPMHVAMAYESIIGWIVGHCPAPDKFAHNYASLAIWLIASVGLRRPTSLVPLAIVIAAEIGNECIDRVAHGSWMWRDTLGDVTATLFWPTVLTLLLRHLFRQVRQTAI